MVKIKLQRSLLEKCYNWLKVIFYIQQIDFEIVKKMISGVKTERILIIKAAKQKLRVF